MEEVPWVVHVGRFGGRVFLGEIGDVSLGISTESHTDYISGLSNKNAPESPFSESHAP